jgi:ABC-type transport system involved in cytochrome c biogenesis permease subunit
MSAMRRIEWLTLGLAVATATAASAAEPGGSAYQTLGNLAVMHHGRVKPLDTLAREEVKQVYGRETIKLTDPKGKTIATWGPVEAWFDWIARPGFWDEQDIILLGLYGESNFQPFKEMVLADPIRSKLKALAEKPGLAVADRERLRTLAGSTEFKQEDLADASRLPGLADDDRKALLTLAHKLDREHKWLSPADLETSNLVVDGKTTTFMDWFGEIYRKVSRSQEIMGGSPKLSPLEKVVSDVGERLFHYQAIRDRNQRGIGSLDILAIPRPQSAAALAYAAEAAKRVQAGGGRELNAVQGDSVDTLHEYLKDLQRDKRQLPGTDATFDKRYTAWLRDKAPWTPLRVLVDGDAKELAASGYDAAKVSAFRTAYDSAVKAEAAAPGKLPEEKARTLVAAARDLGEGAGPYPSAATMDRESHFNRFAPFWWTPYAYGAATVLLLISLGIAATPGTLSARIDRTIYGAGMAALLAAIALEVYGFYLRIHISGWAPVTNMYETVIWVSLVTATLGLVLELIYRKKFAALAASGVALLGTSLAAGVPSLLDPTIKSLTPVLRSNYWLTIHVLTEVSSYAAFALAMGLGLIATFYYLTATYRRSPRPGELAVPLLPGIPLLLGGILGVYASYSAKGPAFVTSLGFFYALALVAGVGMVLTITAVSALLGEAINRATFREESSLDEAAIAGSRAAAEAPAFASASAAVGSGSATATLDRPTVAEIRARSDASRPKLDARGRAMQATAARIKPLSNFIYRAMQVGVLLITAGTILGGVWADYSWGRFWGWDPKEVWALITLLVYLVPLHGRFAGLINTFGLVMASVFCFLSVIMAWYGVNFILGVGLHSYGFVEGGNQGVVLTTVAAALAVVLGAAWRRSLAQRTAPAVA